MISWWALRLGGYLFIRINKIKKDKRFDGIRENPLKFLEFWVFQGLSVWAIMLPVIASFTDQTTTLEAYEYNSIFILGLFIWVVGLGIETLADYEKFTFKNDPKNKDKWIEEGLWKYSRHPNYFGEMLCWWGIFIYLLPFLRSWNLLIGLIGPVYITVLLMFVSGIPILEKINDKKFKRSKKYQEYKKNSRLLVPFPKYKTLIEKLTSFKAV